MQSSIPTISERIANMSFPATDSVDNGVPNDVPSTMQIVRQKFKDNEKVIMIFEAYQIVGQEYPSRLLALVECPAGGTYAIFALAAANLPPRNRSDLTVDKIFPIDDSLQINRDKKSISQCQFELSNCDDTAVKYYYYPTVDFSIFHNHIIAVQKNMNFNSGASNVLSYSWLNDYRQIGEVKHELKRREHEYIVYKNYTIYCATLNVNGKPCSKWDLCAWLQAFDTPPDIYAIGLQEICCNFKIGAIPFSESRPDSAWIKLLLENVPTDLYEELISVRLEGMMLTILIRKPIRAYIARCRVKTVARGVLNQLGNKGGVAVSLQLDEENICFVNAHLAAHMNFVTTRNEDYAGIVKGIIFDDDLRRTINDHEHIFWLGDLNYRIEEPPGLQLPVSRSAPNAYEILLTYDQLRQEMRKGNCFIGYNEGEIRFQPTYKYDAGTDNWDSSEKQRAPAYCDRILWKGARIEQHAYNSVMEIRLSDHKPVYAIFTTKVKAIDEQIYKRVHEEVLKLVDKCENENQPQVTVDKKVVDFGLVRFNEMVESKFIVSNSCTMPVEFMFKVKGPPLNAICENWLQVKPCAGVLHIGNRKSIHVQLATYHNHISDLLRKICLTKGKFDFDILILHVKNGRDIFLTITGEYKPSCFGLSVETLCRTNLPLNEYTHATIKELINDNTPEYRVTMPREFFLLIDFLHKQGNKVAGCFATLDYKHVSSAEFNQIRDWLDNWSTSEFRMYFISYIMYFVFMAFNSI